MWYLHRVYQTFPFYIYSDHFVSAQLAESHLIPLLAFHLRRVLWLITLSPRSRSSTDAVSIDLRGVRRELRFFIEQYRQGHRETTELVSSEGFKTREQISREAERTHKGVEQVRQKMDCLMTLKEAEVDGRIRERFLRSLRYPGFNERRNQVKDAYNDTLKWIFVGDNDDDSDESHGSDVEEDSSDASENSGSDPDWSDSDSKASQSEGDKNEEQELSSETKWDSFSNWLCSTDAIYWISGKPGSGKTTLVKYILANKRTKEYLNMWSPGCEIASHYFWRPGSPMQRNMEGLFCSLLYQLLDTSTIALREVMSSVPGPKHDYTDWSSTELRAALQRALISYTNGVCLFLDGLDEIDPEDGTKDGIPELLDFIFKLSQLGKIKICLASRPDPQILEMSLSMLPRLRLQDLNHGDLMRYAKEHIQFSKTQMSECGHDLLETLVDNADGVFLWLMLASKSINEGARNNDSAETLKKRIDQLPRDLDNLYQDMWSRAGRNNPLEYRQTAALYFKFLLATRDNVFGGWFSLFDLVLTTTPIADGILHALDDASNLISPDSMLQKCREIEQKLKVYCVGLVEVESEVPFDKKDVANESWCGHVYDTIYRVAKSSRLRFIHRTVSDFLSDTESGAKILGFDTLSDFAIRHRLMKAYLASLALFVRMETFNGGWAKWLARFRQTWEGTSDWGSKDWDRFVLTSEKLANSGRLFLGSYDSATPCVGAEFLKVVAWGNLGDEIIISRLKNGNLNRGEKTAVLESISDSHSFDPSFPPRTAQQLSSRLRTLRELLRAGADPNRQGPRSLPNYFQLDFHPAVYLRTPWQLYLLEVFRYLCNSDASSWTPLKPQTPLVFLAEAVLIMISRGAKLDSMVDVYMWWPEEGNKWVVHQSHRSFLWTDWGFHLVVLIPAHTIVQVLTHTLRHCSSQSANDERFFPETCANLERACMNERRSSKCRVIGKMGLERWEDEEDPVEEKNVVWETTDELQTQLGSKLIEALKRQLVVLTPVVEGGSSPHSRNNDETGIFQSISNDEIWVKKVCGRDAIWEWLKELGFVTFVDRSPSLKEWVRKHRCKYLQAGT